MAFGDLLTFDESSFSGTQAFDLGVAPISGNILFLVSGVNNVSATLSTDPASTHGFTLLESQSGNSCGSVAMWYKVSAGTEQTVTAAWSAGLGVGWYGQFDFNSLTLSSAQSNDDLTNVTSTGTSQSTGSVTPAEASNICVGVVFVPNESNCDGGQGWTGGVTVHETVDDAGQAGFGVVSHINQAGSTAFTFSTTDTGDQMWGALAVFNTAGGGASVVPTIVHHMKLQMGI